MATTLKYTLLVFVGLYFACVCMYFFGTINRGKILIKHIKAITIRTTSARRSRAAK